jgi:hypothetical protein
MRDYLIIGLAFLLAWAGLAAVSLWAYASRAPAWVVA